MRTSTTRRKEAIIRFDEDLMSWIANQAKRENKSFNAYLMEIAAEKRSEIEMIQSTPSEISPELKSLCGIIKPFTKQEIAGDARLAHILGRDE